MPTSLRSSWTWTVLAVLLAALAVAAASLDRSGWPSLVGDEATYLMQAESLAFDLDLAYERRDFDRFVEHRGLQPEGLILQSGDAGKTITFGKPFFYALYLAPFVRLAPVHGPFAANALLLAAAALAAAWVLRRRLGAVAPLWIALVVFASIAFVYTFWAHADLFLMCLVALALSLAAAAEGREAVGDTSRHRELLRWAAAGLLLAMVAFSRPMYATLFLPVLAAIYVVARRRGRMRKGTLLETPALAAGALALVLGAGSVHQSLTGSWTSYGAERGGFYSYTGFPEVDFEAATEWQENLDFNRAWLKPSELAARKKIRASLWGWNSLYLLAGRHVGLLPYFLPLFLAFAGRPRGIWSWCLLLAAALSLAAFLHLRPFNFWGGGGAVGNRYFLPLYPVFWFLPRRRIGVPYLAGAAVLAGLFLAPLWLSPRAYPLLEEGEYRYVSTVGQSLLPYETTQSHLKPSGQEDVRHHGLWIKFLDRGLGAVRQGERLRLRGGGWILVGSSGPLVALDVELRAGEDVTLRIDGGELERVGRRGPWQRLRLTLDRPRARHPMWWTSWEPFYLYRLRLDVEGAGTGVLPLDLRPARVETPSS